VDPRESSRSYVFGSSTITFGRIQKMASLGYFTEDATREPREEVIPESAEDESVVFEEFFVAGLSMPPLPLLTFYTCFWCSFTCWPQRFCSIVQVFLGGGELRRCAHQRRFCEML
jgi:hypothetical protein